MLYEKVQDPDLHGYFAINNYSVRKLEFSPRVAAMMEGRGNVALGGASINGAHFKCIVTLYQRNISACARGS